MSDREDTEGVGGYKIDHVIRESLHGKVANREIGGHSENPCSSGGEGENVADGRIDFIEEFDSEPSEQRVIPLTSFAVFRIGLVLELDEHF